MHPKSSLHLKAEGIIAVTTLSACSILLILNFMSIMKSRSHFSDILCFVAMLSTLCGVLTSVWWIFGYNNWLHVNGNYHFLTMIFSHCDIGWRITYVSIILQLYGFIIFILSQIRNLCSHLPPKHQVKSKSYTLSVSILMFLAFIFCLYSMYDHHTLDIGLLEAHDDSNYKYCFSTSGQKSYASFILVTWLTVAVTVTIVGFCGIKSYKRMKHVLSDIIIANYNKKEIRRVLYDIVAFIVLFIMLYMVHKIPPFLAVFPPCSSLVVASIMASNLYRNYKHDLREKNQFNTMKELNQHLPIVPMTSILPSSNSLTSTDEISADSSCDLVYKYQNGLQFMVDEEYVNDSQRVFTILNDIYSESALYHILQEIAVFAATKYEPCMDCMTSLPFVECDKDYNMDYGVLSMLDQYQNTRYYINTHNDGIELLCRLCATKLGVLSNFLLLPTLSKTFQILRTEKQQA